MGSSENPFFAQDGTGAREIESLTFKKNLHEQVGCERGILNCGRRSADNQGAWCIVVVVRSQTEGLHRHPQDFVPPSVEQRLRFGVRTTLCCLRNHQYEYILKRKWIRLDICFPSFVMDRRPRCVLVPRKAQKGTWEITGGRPHFLMVRTRSPWLWHLFGIA